MREVFAKLAITEALLTREARESPRGTAEGHHDDEFRLDLAGTEAARIPGDALDISVSLLLDDAELDLAMREADVTIRMHPLAARLDSAAAPDDAGLALSARRRNT